MKDLNLNIRISQSERESLAEKAKQKGVTVSDLIRSTLQLADPLERVLRRMPINDRQRKYCRLWITDYDEMTADEIETTVNRTLEKYNSDADFFEGGNMDYRLKKNNPLLSEDDEDVMEKKYRYIYECNTCGYYAPCVLTEELDQEELDQSIKPVKPIMCPYGEHIDGYSPDWKHTKQIIISKIEVKYGRARS